MIRSETMANLATALAKAHAAFQPLTKNRSVTVRPREGSPYSFDYATLDNIMDCIRGPLAANGLSVVHTVHTDDNGLSVETIIVHASGEFLGTAVPVKTDRPGNQALGSAITYARRYGITALLGLAADDDDDGNAADGHHVERRYDRQPNQRQAPPTPEHAAPPTPEHAAPPAGPTGQATGRARCDAALAKLTSALGAEEAHHQANALKTKHGMNKMAALTELEGMAAHHAGAA